jgi:hypothetical protein
MSKVTMHSEPLCDAWYSTQSQNMYYIEVDIVRWLYVVV